MLERPRPNRSPADDARATDRCSAGEDELGGWRKGSLLQPCPHMMIETGRGCREIVVEAAAGDAMPRVQQASTPRNPRLRGREKSPVTDDETAAGLHQGLRRAHVWDLRCARDSIHHAR